MNEKVSLQNIDKNSRSLAPLVKPASPLTQTSNLVLTGLGGLGLAGILFWEANFLTYAFTLGGFSLAFLRSLVGYIFREKNGQAQQDRERQAAFYELKRKIRRTQFLENIEKLGEKLNSQFDQVLVRLQELDQTLRVKFNPGELTFSRYATAIQQSYFSLIDQFENSAELLQSLSLTSDASLRQQQKKLETSQNQEIESLQKRLELRENQKMLVEELLSINEKVLAQWEHLLASLREVKTRENVSGVDLESSLSELKNLAERAKKYSL